MSLVAIPAALATIAGCPLFPATNPWNQSVDGLPVAGNSKAMIKNIGANARSWPSFGSGRWEGAPVGMPVNVVGRDAKTSKVRFRYASGSDRKPYPIPGGAKLQAGADRHLIIVQRETCALYELFDARKRGGKWTAGSGAIFDLRSDAMRPEGWTSADAAGLPILPGLVRWDELRTGSIDHALRITVPRTRKGYLFPARHDASSSRNRNLPAFGQRLRLKKSVDAAKFGPQARIIIKALQTYGALVADHGQAWVLSGSPSERWDNEDLHRLDRLKGSDFEVVDTTSLPVPNVPGVPRPQVPVIPPVPEVPGPGLPVVPPLP